MKRIVITFALAILVVSFALSNASAKTKPYRVITDTQICTNDNNKHEVYLRATDNSVDSQGEHRNLLNKHPLSKLTVDYVSIAGKLKIIKWNFSFNPKVIKVPKLRVYGLLDDIVSKDYQYLPFSLKQHDYVFHFHLNQNGAACAS